MKILCIPGNVEEESVERWPQFLRVLKERHSLVFLEPKEKWIQKRAFWPFRAWERFHITRELTGQGRACQGIDLVLCKDYMHALPGAKIAKHLKVPSVWDSDGSMKAFWDDSHRFASQVLPWMWLEKWLTKQIDYMITVTENDRQCYIRQGMDPNRIHVIPVCVRTKLLSQKTKREARESLGLSLKETFFLFFANFNYLPNKKALHFLNEEVAPKLPGRLLLCGRGKLPRKLHPKINYLGFVPLQQLFDLIRAADIGLSPVWEANGTLTKVIDMLSHGIPTIITKPIQKGIPQLQDEVHTLVAKTPKDFVEKTLHLAQDVNLQERLKNSALEIIEKKYSWHLYENRLLELIENFGMKNA